MKRNHFILICLILLLFTSCSGKKNEEKLISGSEMNEIDQKTEEKIKEDDKAYSVSDKGFNDVRPNMEINMLPTSDGRDIFLDHTILNISLNECRINCSKPGCTHMQGSCEADRLDEQQSRRYYDGGMLYLNKTSLCYEKNGKTEVLLNNDRCGGHTSKVRNLGNNDEYRIHSFIFMDENTLAIAGCNYVFSYNIKTGEKGEIAEAGEAFGFLFLAAAGSDELFAGNNDNELFRINLKSGETVKLFDHVTRGKVYGGRLYYIQFIDGKNILNSCDTDGSNVKKVKEHIGFSYCILPDGSLMYTRVDDDNAVFLDRGDGKEELYHRFSEGVKVQAIGSYTFSDRIFVYVNNLGDGYTHENPYISDLKFPSGFMIIDTKSDEKRFIGPVFDGYLPSVETDADSGSLSVLTDIDGAYYPVSGRELSFNEENYIELKIELSYSTPTRDGDIPVRVFAYCDGDYLRIGNPDTKGENAEQSLDFSITEGKKESLGLRIYAPKEGFSHQKARIMLIAEIDPEYIAKDEGKSLEVDNLLYGTIRLDVPDRVNSGKKEVMGADNSLYIPGRGNWSLDFGYETYKETVGNEEYIGIRTNVSGNPLHARKDENSLYIKAYLGNELDETDHEYEMLCFADGMPYRIFDGEYALKLSFKKGSRVFAYQIPGSCYPEAGEHMVQLMLIPGEKEDGIVFPHFSGRRYLRME